MTKVTISTAVAAVAAEIIPGLPPVIATRTAIEKEAYNPTFGSTPAITENAIASGIKARATTKPESKSPFIFEVHWFLYSLKKNMTVATSYIKIESAVLSRKKN